MAGGAVAHAAATPEPCWWTWTLSPKPAPPMFSAAPRPAAELGHPGRLQRWACSPGYRSPASIFLERRRSRAGGCWYREVVNVGGAMFLLGVETQGWTQERAEKEVVETVRRALRQVFELAATEGIPTDAAALQIAEERLSAAK